MDGLGMTAIHPQLIQHAHLRMKHFEGPLLERSLSGADPQPRERSRSPVLPFFHSPILLFSHSTVLPFSPSPVLPFSSSPVLPFSCSLVLPFPHSPVLPFSRSPVLPFSGSEQSTFNVLEPIVAGNRKKKMGGGGFLSGSKAHTASD